MPYMCIPIQDVCPEVTNPEQDPVACQPDATAMQGRIMILCLNCPECSYIPQCILAVHMAPMMSGISYGLTLLEGPSALNPVLVEWMQLVCHHSHTCHLTF